MKKKIRQVGQLTLSALLVVSMAALVLVPSVTVGAQSLDPCDLDSSGTLCAGQNNDIDSVFRTIINVLLFVLGAISVIVIIISGIRYTTSGGNANSVAAAKNTLIYAIVGLAVAIFAFAIVNFIIDRTT